MKQTKDNRALIAKENARRPPGTAGMVLRRLAARDALVTFVADGTPMALEVNVLICTQREWRWKVVPGGRVLKVPFAGGVPPPGPFEVEARGWGHEFCRKCSSLVQAGTECWADDGDIFPDSLRCVPPIAGKAGGCRHRAGGERFGHSPIRPGEVQP